MRILFATDGSREAQAAAQLLLSLTLGPEDSVTLLTVVPEAEAGYPPKAAPGVLAAPYSDHAVTVLTDARDVLCHTMASLRTEVRCGHAADEILRAATDHRADLVVVGACGLSTVRRFLIGSVAERVVRHSACPVLVVRPLSIAVREVILGVDDSPSSTRAAEWLGRFLLPSDSEVRLVTILPLLDIWLRTRVTLTPPLVDEIIPLAEHERDLAQERLRSLAATITHYPAAVASGAKARQGPGPLAGEGMEPLPRRGSRGYPEGSAHAVAEIRSGDPALGLLQLAEEEGADLIVVGSHGQSAIERFLLGSVSEKVLRHAHCSVLVVK